MFLSEAKPFFLTGTSLPLLNPSCWVLPLQVLPILFLQITAHETRLAKGPSDTTQPLSPSAWLILVTWFAEQPLKAFLQSSQGSKGPPGGGENKQTREVGNGLARCRRQRTFSSSFISRNTTSQGL